MISFEVWQKCYKDGLSFVASIRAVSLPWKNILNYFTRADVLDLKKWEKETRGRMSEEG